MPSVIWDGNARELAQKEIGAPLYALYVGGEKKKKNPAREAVKVLSIQFSVYLGASHQAAPSLACDADVLWGRQCEETEGKRCFRLPRASKSAGH